LCRAERVSVSLCSIEPAIMDGKPAPQRFGLGGPGNLMVDKVLLRGELFELDVQLVERTLKRKDFFFRLVICEQSLPFLFTTGKLLLNRGPLLGKLLSDLL
jgi:hypothetical protein